MHTVLVMPSDCVHDGSRVGGCGDDNGDGGCKGDGGSDCSGGICDGNAAHRLQLCN